MRVLLEAKADASTIEYKGSVAAWHDALQQGDKAIISLCVAAHEAREAAEAAEAAAERAARELDGAW
jgi:hypothetical protein